MDISADAVTGIMENTTVKNMSDTLQSCVSEDDIIKIEEPDLEDYQSGDALGTPLSDLHIQVQIHANVPHTVDLEVDVEETDYCENSDPDFKSFVVVEEASVRVQATGLQGEGNGSSNKIMNELNEILYFEQSASVSVNANKQEQHLVKTHPDSTDNDPQLKIDAEFETERFLANDERNNVRVPMYSDTKVEAIAELSDRRAERTTDVAAKHVEKEPTHLDL
ncbi:hypothetical protein DPMN_082755 [Dreissena polymorpha]|uniref:Uncharacterized protein n=1 Tax=Dreissena polymorpha TaxID=45954 RepID=A0A9D3Y7J1_DREPO|nr:hypothetical protein DPMN_082755 [Dreissena polymorpha]